MADASGSNPPGHISGQQIGRDGDKAEQGRSGDKCCEASRQRHRQHRQKLPGDKYRYKLAVVDPVAEWQQQQYAQRERYLVERRSKPDGRAADAEFFGNRRDQRMNIIGIGHHRRRG